MSPSTRRPRRHTPRHPTTPHHQIRRLRRRRPTRRHVNRRLRLNVSEKSSNSTDHEPAGHRRRRRRPRVTSTATASSPDANPAASLIGTHEDPLPNGMHDPPESFANVHVTVDSRPPRHTPRHPTTPHRTIRRLRRRRATRRHVDRRLPSKRVGEVIELDGPRTRWTPSVAADGPGITSTAIASLPVAIPHVTHRDPSKIRAPMACNDPPESFAVVHVTVDSAASAARAAAPDNTTPAGSGGSGGGVPHAATSASLQLKRVRRGHQTRPTTNPLDTVVSADGPGITSTAVSVMTRRHPSTSSPGPTKIRSPLACIDPHPESVRQRPVTVDSAASAAHAAAPDNTTPSPPAAPAAACHTPPRRPSPPSQTCRSSLELGGPPTRESTVVAGRRPRDHLDRHRSSPDATASSSSGPSKIRPHGMQRPTESFANVHVTVDSAASRHTPPHPSTPHHQIRRLRRRCATRRHINRRSRLNVSEKSSNSSDTNPLYTVVAADGPGITSTATASLPDATATSSSGPSKIRAPCMQRPTRVVRQRPRHRRLGGLRSTHRTPDNTTRAGSGGSGGGVPHRRSNSTVVGVADVRRVHLVGGPIRPLRVDGEVKCPPSDSRTSSLNVNVKSPHAGSADPDDVVLIVLVVCPRDTSPSTRCPSGPISQSSLKGGGGQASWVPSPTNGNAAVTMLATVTDQTRSAFVTNGMYR